MNETIAATFLVLGVGLFFLYFIVRPLAALGDIPKRIDDLTDAVKELTEVLKKKRISGGDTDAT